MCVEIHTCTTRGAPFLFRKSGYFENVDIMKKGIVFKSGFFEKIVTKNAHFGLQIVQSDIVVHQLLVIRQCQMI